MVDTAFQVSCFIDVSDVRAEGNLGNHVVQTMHVTGEKKKGDGGPRRQLGAEERQPTPPASRSGHQEGADPAHRCFLSLSLGLPSIPVISLTPNRPGENRMYLVWVGPKH